MPKSKIKPDGYCLGHASPIGSKDFKPYWEYKDMITIVRGESDISVPSIESFDKIPICLVSPDEKSRIVPGQLLDELRESLEKWSKFDYTICFDAEALLKWLNEVCPIQEK